MAEPVQITFKDMPPSPAIEAWIREHASKLTRYHDHIVHCQVVVEAPHRHQQRGHLYNVRLDITVAGGEVVVSHQGPKDEAHRDVYVALRDAFHAARRQLQDQVRKQRGKVKHHTEPAHGRVTKLFPHEGYGFLETPDELEVYFHENSVLGAAFSDLDVGTKVRFVLAEGEGEAGPQASTVEVLA
jgi:ribosomal subunit interface protein